LASVLSKPQSNVPIELIVACICTESSGNPTAIRREPGCDTTDFDRTPTRASTGLMQTLVSTARSALNEPALTGEDLMSPEKSIQAGATYIFIQARETLFDPPFVAAAYNAGGIYYEGTPANHWRLRQYPIGTSNHVDRFTRYLNGAFKALGQVSLPDSVPSLQRLLGSL
jgi:soluble lytic murein transglycosylase-like protein